MATFVSNLFYLFLACLIYCYIVIASFERYYDEPGPSKHEQIFIINKGQSVENVASHLRELNLIKNRMFFMLVVRLKGFHDQIKFGEYLVQQVETLISLEFMTNQILLIDLS